MLSNGHIILTKCVMPIDVAGIINSPTIKFNSPLWPRDLIVVHETSPMACHSHRVTSK